MRAGRVSAFGSDSVGEMGLQQSVYMLCSVSDLVSLESKQLGINYFISEQKFRRLNLTVDHHLYHDITLFRIDSTPIKRHFHETKSVKILTVFWEIFSLQPRI